MKELDKRIKDKMDGHTLSPSANLWDSLDKRLDQQIADKTSTVIEMNSEATTQQKANKTLWYCSVAASVAILIGCALWMSPNVTSTQTTELAIVEPLPRESYDLLESRISELETTSMVMELVEVCKTAIDETENKISTSSIVETVEEEKKSITITAELTKHFIKEETSNSIDIYIEDIPAENDKKITEETKSEDEEIRIEYIPGKKRRVLASLLPFRKSKQLQ